MLKWIKLLVGGVKEAAKEYKTQQMLKEKYPKTFKGKRGATGVTHGQELQEMSSAFKKGVMAGATGVATYVPRKTKEYVGSKFLIGAP